jgi:hypothetical protein
LQLNPLNPPGVRSDAGTWPCNADSGVSPAPHEALATVVVGAGVDESDEFPPPPPQPHNATELTISPYAIELRQQPILCAEYMINLLLRDWL